jgi:hypothetical protein
LVWTHDLKEEDKLLLYNFKVINLLK